MPSADNKTHDASFAIFVIPSGELDENGCYVHDTIVIDSKMNNAPNISGTDNFDVSFRNKCHIIFDNLYFTHNGVRYLIDGDYNVLAKFPYNLDVSKYKYISNTRGDNTKQYILKKENGWCIYDIEKKRLFMMML